MARKKPTRDRKPRASKPTAPAAQTRPLDAGRRQGHNIPAGPFSADTKALIKANGLKWTPYDEDRRQGSGLYGRRGVRP